MYHHKGHRSSRQILLQSVVKRIVFLLVLLLVLVSGTICLTFWEKGIAIAAQTAASGTHLAADKVIETIREHTRRGQLKEALVLLVPYSHEPQAYPTLYSDYLVILTWDSQREEAIRRFESLPASFPKRPYLLRNMANAYVDLGLHDKAEKLYEQVLVQDPEDLEALEGMTASFMLRGDTGKTKQAMDQAPDATKKTLRYQLLRARLLLENGRYLEALRLYDRLIESRPGNADKIVSIRDDKIAGLSDEKQQHLLATLASTKEKLNNTTPQYQALCLVLTRRYADAVGIMEKNGIDPGDTKLPENKHYWFAWAYFKAGRIDAAKTAFNTILNRDSGNVRARIGLAYCYTAKKEYDQTAAILKRLETAYPNNSEVLFAKAYLFEAQERFWEAVQVYEHLLQVSPYNRTALRLRTRALSDMGATSLARNRAHVDLPDDEGLDNSIRRDAAVDQIHWEESGRAVRRLKTMAAKDDGYAFDYIAALSKAQRYSEVLTVYEHLTAGDAQAPLWTRQIVADAYLAEQKPHQALRLYNQILDIDPGSFQARMGKFYVFQELRRWEEAQALLDALDNETADTLSVGGRPRPNPRKFELAVTRAWLLAYQDRLGDAQGAFQGLYEQAPANLDVRNGLAHVYLWRGWPRRSLQTFSILESMNASYQPADTGHIMALNTLALKRQANQKAVLLLKRRPNDKRIQQTVRALSVEQMNVWRTDVSGKREDDDTYDIRISTEMSTPMSLKTRLYGFLVWRRTWRDATTDDLEEPAYHRRVGLGVDHIVNSDWRLNAAVSANYDDGKDEGILMRIDFNPTDTWFFGVYGDTFSTDISQRARTAGIDASKWGLDAVWRQSEWRQADVGYTGSRFSDGNLRDEFSAGYEQNLWMHNNWRMRVFIDFYVVSNSKGDETFYYNPKDAWSVSVTHMTEQTIRNLYHRSFVHRLYATGGNYKQNGFGGAFTGSLRYEQSYSFSDRHALTAGIGVGRSVYDGESVDDVSVDMVYQWRF